MPGLRGADRRPRQHPRRLLAAAARPGALLRGADLAPLSAHRADRRRALRRRPSSSTGTTPPKRRSGWSSSRCWRSITLTDLERRIIPNKVLIAGAVICLAIAIPTDPGGVPERLIAAAAAGGVFFLVVLAQPRGMGLGDAKLAATMGLFLGRAVAPAILVGLLAGTLVGLALIASRGTEARKMAIPFGPFLAIGGVVGLLAGHHLVDLYLG